MMNYSELQATRAGWCKEHRNVHKQVPGVCSFCLSDKLSQLYTTNSPIEPIICYSPSPISSPDSPSTRNHASSNNHDVSSAVHRKRFRRNGSHAMGSGPSCILGFNNLKKSRSLAFATRNSRGRSKSDGFWSKVLKLKRKDTGVSVVNSRVAY